MSNSRSKVFRDAIHGLISIDSDRELLLELINTREFQRLRRIRQLGVSSLTYPNAEHTRFSHSLGVLHIATRILNTLHLRYRDDHKIVSRLQGKEGRQVKVAALLHDLGHGPFSHAIEDVFRTKKAHEERSKRMVDDPCSTIPAVLGRHGFTPLEINETKQLLDYHDIPYIHDIISSSLDADRMDYLLRDSHFTGVKYGSYDLEWVINSFCLGEDPAPEAKGRLRLCLDEKRGQYAAEQLIMARTHMTMQVYGHGVTRLWEAHLLMLFHEATHLASNDLLPRETPDHVTRYFRNKGEVDHETFLLFDEPSLIAAMSLWSVSKHSTPKLKWFSEAFLNRTKVLKMREIEPPPQPRERLEEIRRTLTHEIGPEREEWILDNYDFKPYQAPKEEVIKTDRDGYWEGISKNAILLSRGESNTPSIPIQLNSLLFNTICSEKMPLTRLFYDPKHEGLICSLDKKLFQPLE